MTEETKECSRCNQILSLTKFGIRKNNGRPTSHCRKCMSDKQRELRARNPDYLKNRKKWYQTQKERLAIVWRASQYKITHEQVEYLLKETHCKICGCQFDGTMANKLCFDHDHKTDRIRGTLCSSCNLMLGYAKDDVHLLEKAKQYLINNRGV